MRTVRIISSLAIAAIVMAGCVDGNAKTAKRERTMGLFDFVTAVAKLDKLDRAGLERLTGRSFEAPLAAASTGNEYYAFRRMQSFAIDGLINANAIELREPNNRAVSPHALLTMQVNGGCVTRDAITARYGSMQLIDAPRGRSQNERWSYETKVGTTAVRFSFDQSDQFCLTGLAFEDAN